MPTPTVFYEMIEKGISEGGELGKTECSRWFQVAYLDRWTFVEEAFGFVRPAGGVIQRSLPWEYPWRGGLYPRRFRFEGKGRRYVDGNFEFAHVEVTWGEPEFHELEEDPETGSVALYSIRATGETQYRTIPNTQIKYASDNKPVTQPIATIWPVETYQLTLHRVPFFPRGFLRKLVGTCNENLVQIGKETFDPQTLAIQGWSADREITFSGLGLQIPAWSVVINLSECSYGFNNLIREDTGDIEEVSPTGAIVPVSANFDRLLWLLS